MGGFWSGCEGAPHAPEHDAVCAPHRWMHTAFLHEAVHCVSLSEQRLRQSSPPLPSAAPAVNRMRSKSLRISAKLTASEAAMATRGVRWTLIATLALSLSAYAQQKYPKTVEEMDKMDEADPLQQQEKKPKPKIQERGRGTADPCKMNCAKESFPCTQKCSQPIDPESPEFKDEKSVKKKAESDTTKCFAACGKTHMKCMQACK